MNEDFSSLITEARAALGQFDLPSGFSAGSVAAAVQTKNGNIFTGICIDVACGIGFCAEHAAIAEMLKCRETEITKIVAVKENAILVPCGRCREFIHQIDPRNIKAKVLLSEDRILTLEELLPEYRIFEEKKAYQGAAHNERKRSS